MDRRYYGLKALAIAVALLAAVLGSGFEYSRLETPHNPNYQAAYVTQAAIMDAGVKFGRTVYRVFSCTMSGL
jgi:hypothetical protein